MVKKKTGVSKRKSTKKILVKPEISVDVPKDAVSFNDPISKEFSQSEYSELLFCLKELQNLFAKKWMTLLSIKTDVPVIFNGTIIDRPFMGVLSPNLDFINPFIDDNGVPCVGVERLSELESIENSCMSFESTRLSDNKEKLETIRRSLDTVLNDYQRGFENVDTYCDVAFLDRANHESLYNIFRIANRIFLDPKCIKEVPIKFYLKFFGRLIKNKIGKLLFWRKH